jgi:hypothetical protein
MKKISTFLCFLLIGINLPAQQDSSLFKSSNWSFKLSAGINSFATNGIPPSRNQMNYQSSSSPNKVNYNQESRVVGLTFEGAAHYKVAPQLRLGLALNFFRDDDEYLNSSDLSMNVMNIESDSLRSLSIKNLQSYVNFGISLEYDILLGKKQMHKLTFGVISGVTINRTPDRTEYDYYAQNNYIQAPIGDDNEKWYITHTGFNSGLFVMPSISYGFKIKNNHYLNFTLSTSQHRLSTAYQVQMLDRNSSGTYTTSNYLMRSIQFKLGFTL